MQSTSVVQEPLAATPADRIVVLDVLRAFALFGIIITHAAMGFLAGPPPDPSFNVFSALDRSVAEAVRLLTIGKFFAIFSFLFGLSFAIQIESAARKNAPFAGRFAWRLTILLVIAFVHGLFFSGDILIVYALLGFLLIPLRRVKTAVLVAAAVVLVLNVPGVVTGWMNATATPTPAQQQASREQGRQFAERAKQQYEIKRAGSVGELVAMNFKQSFITKLQYQIRTGRLWITFGFFLLGMCAGRIALFRDTHANRKLLTSVLRWAGAIAAVTTIVAVYVPVEMRGVSLRNVGALTAFSVQQASLAAFYVAGLTLLFWKTRACDWLQALAPMGKMGLTVYLTQTVFGLIAFYGVGFGLLGRWGVGACVVLGIAFYLVQIVLAQVWMRYFSLGPVEWVWRSLTHMRLQPNLKASLSTT